MMIVDFFNKNRKLVSLIVLVCLEIYWFFLFLPLPPPIGTGLDPSWQYAITQAAEDGLMWGKDIIFTFGPLGYLISGVALENKIVLLTIFPLIIHLALFVIFTLKIINLDSWRDKIVLTSGFFLAFWLGQILGTDYKILFILLLILSFDQIIAKYLRVWAFILGSLSGFCLLTKFSLGIATLGCLTLFFLGNIYQCCRYKKQVKRSVFALFDTLLSATSVAFILLNPPSFLTRFSQIIFFLICSGGVAVILFFIQKTRHNVSLFLLNKFTLERNEISWIVFYIVYTILLFSSIIHSPLSLIDYFTTSLQISSGYSSAMSLITRYLRRFSFEFITLPIGLLGYFLSLIILTLLVKEGTLSFALAILFSLFISFKHGFIRQDFHILYFSSLTLFVIPLCLTKIKSLKIKKVGHILSIYILIMAIVFQCFVQSRFINQNFVTDLTLRLSQRLAPSYVIKGLNSIFNFNEFSDNVQEKSKQSLETVTLPKDVTNIVKNQTVDIIPWEISLVAANNLNWRPRPIFQSYSAYTKKLDKINFESYLENPRDYIFYTFLSIDGRHPFFDEPKTFSYVFCNYQPSDKISGFINTPKVSSIILLEKSDNKCLPVPATSDKGISLPWNTVLPLETYNNIIIKANIDIKYSLPGKLIKAIFRVPPVTIVVNYKDSSTETYRIIPENSQNGVIVSHLPKQKNHEEVLSFFKGELVQQVDSISFKNRNSLLYKPTINLTLSSVSIK